MLVGIASPLVSGSFRALIPALMGMPLLALKTYLEDKTLKEELPGYREYMREVKYKVIPFV